MGCREKETAAPQAQSRCQLCSAHAACFVLGWRQSYAAHQAGRKPYGIRSFDLIDDVGD